MPSHPSLDDPTLYINREMSWLAFNARVLEEAKEPAYPLLERLKFVAIHASNLDEFFMIRVSGLHEQLEAELTEMSPDGLGPREQLAMIRKEVEAQKEQAYTLLSGELLPLLETRGLHMCNFAELDPETQERANEYFNRSVFPVLTPLAVDMGHPFPFLSNLSLSLAVEVKDPDHPDEKFARVKVPESLPRFIALDALGKAQGAFSSPDTRMRLLPLEQLIAVNLPRLFPELSILGWYPFRVTRDTDLDILADEADDLMSIVDREIRRRRFGACVRLEVDRGISPRIRKLLCDKLEIDEDDVYEVTGLLGLSQLISLAALERPDLRDVPFVPRVPGPLTDKTAIYAAIRAGDVLLHHPYDSFMPVLDWLGQAALDPNVLAIKMTLYRTGSNAEVVRTLIRAAENGKQVAVSIELKARFDEENNMVWARTLERAGVHVFYGTPGMKTHAKIALVVRREGDALRSYVHLSTGNYNPSTARLYTDIALFTADPDIGEDVSELFNALSGFSKQKRFRKLAAAPQGLAEALLQNIEAEAEEARQGRPARIFVKLNSLVDGAVIRALYRASQAGVSIELVIRGICCLRPGLPGVSENIRVRSILGRFLEHERVFIFGVTGRERFYISSADWMPRNFYRRVEVLVPIESEPLREQLRREVEEPALRADLRSYVLSPEGHYTRHVRDGEIARVSAQTLVLEQTSEDPGRLSSTHPRVLANPPLAAERPSSP